MLRFALLIAMTAVLANSSFENEFFTSFEGIVEARSVEEQLLND